MELLYIIIMIILGIFVFFTGDIKLSIGGIPHKKFNKISNIILRIIVVILTSIYIIKLIKLII